MANGVAAPQQPQADEFDRATVRRRRPAAATPQGDEFDRAEIRRAAPAVPAFDPDAALARVRGDSLPTAPPIFARAPRAAPTVPVDLRPWVQRTDSQDAVRRQRVTRAAPAPPPAPNLGDALARMGAPAFTPPPPLLRDVTGVTPSAPAIDLAARPRVAIGPQREHAEADMPVEYALRTAKGLSNPARLVARALGRDVGVRFLLQGAQKFMDLIGGPLGLEADPRLRRIVETANAQREAELAGHPLQAAELTRGLVEFLGEMALIPGASTPSQVARFGPRVMAEVGTAERTVAAPVLRALGRVPEYVRGTVVENLPGSAVSRIARRAAEDAARFGYIEGPVAAAQEPDIASAAARQRAAAVAGAVLGGGMQTAGEVASKALQGVVARAARRNVPAGTPEEVPLRPALPTPEAGPAPRPPPEPPRPAPTAPEVGVQAPPVVPEAPAVPPVRGRAEIEADIRAAITRRDGAAVSGDQARMAAAQGEIEQLARERAQVGLGGQLAEAPSVAPAERPRRALHDVEGRPIPGTERRLALRAGEPERRVSGVVGVPPSGVVERRGPVAPPAPSAPAAGAVPSQGAMPEAAPRDHFVRAGNEYVASWDKRDATPYGMGKKAVGLTREQAIQTARDLEESGHKRVSVVQGTDYHRGEEIDFRAPLSAEQVAENLAADAAAARTGRPMPTPKPERPSANLPKPEGVTQSQWTRHRRSTTDQLVEANLAAQLKEEELRRFSGGQRGGQMGVYARQGQLQAGIQDQLELIARSRGITDLFERTAALRESRKPVVDEDLWQEHLNAPPPPSWKTLVSEEPVPYGAPERAAPRLREAQAKADALWAAAERAARGVGELERSGATPDQLREARLNAREIRTAARRAEATERFLERTSVAEESVPYGEVPAKAKRRLAGLEAQMREGSQRQGWTGTPQHQALQRAIQKARQEVAAAKKSGRGVAEEMAPYGGTLPDHRPVAVEQNHLVAPEPPWRRVATHPALRAHAVRLKSDGYGGLDEERDVRDVLQKVGATVLSEQPALMVEGGPYVGTIGGGPLKELHYRLADGSERYLYLLTTVVEDSWGQEWWGSSHRLSAEAAFDAIREARQGMQALSKDLRLTRARADEEIGAAHPDWLAVEFWQRPQEYRQELYRRGLLDESGLVPANIKAVPSFVNAVHRPGMRDDDLARDYWINALVGVLRGKPPAEALQVALTEFSQSHGARVIPPSELPSLLDQLSDQAARLRGDASASGVAEGAAPYGAPPRNPALDIGTGQFYSRVVRTAETAKLTKATGAEWDAYLSKQPMLREEYEYTLQPWLREHAGEKLTREQVGQAARERQVRLTETVLGGRSPAEEVNEQRTQAALHEANVRLRAELTGLPVGTDPSADFITSVRSSGLESTLRQYEHQGGDWADAAATVRHSRAAMQAAREVERLQAAAYAAQNLRAGGTPRYASFVESGGTNYREVVIQLDRPEMAPEKVRPSITAIAAFDGEWAQQAAERNILDRKLAAGRVSQADYEAQRDTIEANLDAIHRRMVDRTLEEMRAAGTPLRDGPPYRSPHWEGIDNPLVHIRLDDRVGPNGEKVLFVEEAQSDWHQQGREQGYRDAARMAELGQQINRLSGQILPENFSEAMGRKIIERDNLRREYARESNAAPDAPFKKTEDWLGLAWRRIVDEAVAGGYARIAWTSGAQQAARYDLGRVVDQLLYWPDEVGGYLRVYKDRDLVDARPVSPEELPTVVGKEAARRLLDSLPLTGQVAGYPRGINTAGAHHLEGEGLRVGGEGMKAFYDQIVPNVVRAWAKRHGVRAAIEPVDVGMPGAKGGKEWRVFDVVDGHEVATFEERAQAQDYVEGNLGLDYDRVGPNVPAPSIRVTPEMAQGIRARGQEIAEGPAPYGAIPVLTLEAGRPRDLGEALIAEFGETEIPEHAGFLLSDGRLVNLEGDFGVRGADHRAVGRLFDYTVDGKTIDPQTVRGGRWAAVQKVMDDGHARISVQRDLVSVDISRDLTHAQVRIVRRIVGQGRGQRDLVLEFTKDGNVLATVERPRALVHDVDDAVMDLMARAAQAQVPAPYGVAEAEAPLAAAEPYVPPSPEVAEAQQLELVFGSPDGHARAAKLGLDANRVPTFDERRQVIPTEKKTWVDVRGKRVDNAPDVALVNRPFRSPQAETIEFLHLAEDGAIAARDALTSGAINYVDLDLLRVAADLADRARRTGTSVVRVSHNHPSGEVVPSTGDLVFTEGLQALLGQPRYIALAGGRRLTVEHTIINNRTASHITIDADGRARVALNIPVEMPVSGEAVPDWTEVKGPQLNSPEAVARVVGHVADNELHVIYRDNTGRAVTMVPHRQSAAATIAMWVPQEARALGAVDAIIAVSSTNVSLWRRLVNNAPAEVRDVIGIDPGTGAYSSGHAQGIVGQFGTEPTRPARHVVGEEAAEYRQPPLPPGRGAGAVPEPGQGARRSPLEGTQEPVTVKDVTGQAGDYEVHLERIHADPAGTRAVLERVARLRVAGEIPDKKVVTFAENIEAAKTVNLQAALAQHGALSGPVGFAIKAEFDQNDQFLRNAYTRQATLAQGTLAWEQAQRDVALLERYADRLLQRFIPGASENGRQLVMLKIAGTGDLEPFGWYQRAQKMKGLGEPLTTEERQAINGFIDAGDRNGLVTFVNHLRPKLTWRDPLWYTTIRKSLMLSGRAFFRNFFGNTGRAFFQAGANWPARGFDVATAGITGRRQMVLPDPDIVAAMFEGMGEGFGKMRAAMRGEWTEAETAKIESALGGRELSPKGVNAVVQFFFNLQIAGDRPTYWSAYRRSIATFAKLQAQREGLTGKAAMQRRLELEQDTPVEVAALAVHEALKAKAHSEAKEASYQDTGYLSRVARGIRGALREGRKIWGLKVPPLPTAEALFDYAFPFTQTPSSVTAYNVSALPVAVVRTPVDLIRLFRWAKGKQPMDEKLVDALQHDINKQFGRWAFGLLPVGLAYWAYKEGLLTGPAKPKGGVATVRRLAGWKPFSLRAHGQYIPLWQLGPWGATAAFGATLAWAGEEENKNLLEATPEALQQVANTIMETPFLRGFKDVNAFLQNVKGGAGAIGRAAVTSWVPTGLGGLARASDTVERQNTTIWEAVRGRVPGLRQTVEPQVSPVSGENVRGEPNTFVRALKEMVEPLGISRDRAADDPVLGTLLDYRVGITSPQRLPNESATTYTRRQREIGRRLHEELQQDPAYLEAVDPQGSARPRSEITDDLQDAVRRIQRRLVRESKPDTTAGTRRVRAVRRRAVRRTR